MALQTDTMKAEGRFAVLLADAIGPETYDRPLMKTRDWVVAPTLGAIVPNWLIVVPRRPALNFRSWHEKTGTNPAAIVSDLCEHLSLAADKVLWFEHGPKIVGTEVGCGVDYAHLHLILDPAFSFETFMERVEESSSLDWQQSSPKEAYSRLTGRNSYLVIGMGNHVKITEGVEQTGSQFLRRMVAAAIGQAEMWNYRHHPHHANIARTVETFRALESAARRSD